MFHIQSKYCVAYFIYLFFNYNYFLTKLLSFFWVIKPSGCLTQLAKHSLPNIGPMLKTARIEVSFVFFVCKLVNLFN